MTPEKNNRRMAALEMVARGADLEETLQTLLGAGDSGPDGLEPGNCAFLILKDEHLELGASTALTASAGLRLQLALRHPFCGMEKLAESLEAQVRPLVSGASEILGAVALFGEDAIWPDAVAEMMSIAALAVEQNNLQQELTYRADFDALTGIWNGQRMGQEIHRALARSRRTAAIGVVCVDLDRFRLINEILGHRTGDEVLRQVAGRFQQTAGAGVSPARVRGDEFLFLIRNARPEDTVALAERLVACMREPFQVGEHSLSLMASAGSCTGDAAGFGAEEIQRSANLAVNYAKRLGRNRAVRYDPSMAATPPERLEMERHLRSALANGEMLVHYQPQVDLATGRMSGVEALARWKHPSIGFISPSTFIPLAEEIGVVSELGSWIFREALRDIQRIREWEGLSELRISINVSAIQMAQTDFAGWVIQEIEAAGLDPAAIELEITESILMKDFAHVLKQMQTLAGRGVLFSIDDFGTGHSSLAYLRELPFQQLKIDQKFIRDIQSAEDRPPVLENIIHLARALKVPVIAEGIENAHEESALLGMKCQVGQGYLFAKPMGMEDLRGWVTTNSAAAVVRAVA